MCTKEKIQKERSERTLNEIKLYVANLNGKCISETYINNQTNLEFECENGHRFFESWSDIKNVLRWCPHCSPNKLIGETLSRLILEHLLKIKLPSAYIESMEGLELDGYNSEKKLHLNTKDISIIQVIVTFINQMSDFKVKRKEIIEKKSYALKKELL